MNYYILFNIRAEQTTLKREAEELYSQIFSFLIFQKKRKEKKRKGKADNVKTLLEGAWFHELLTREQK